MSAPMTLHFVVPARLDQLGEVSRRITAFLRTVPGLADDESLHYNIDLAVDEIVVNIIEHGYGATPGTIRFTVTADDDRVTVETVDYGRRFDPDNVPAPDLDHAQVGGYGLFLVHQLMDEVHYRHDAARGANHWRLTRRRNG